MCDRSTYMATLVGRSPGAWTLALAAWAAVQACAVAQTENPVPSFERSVVPILRAHCFKCHGLEGLESQLDLRSVPLMLRGGKQGAILMPGSANSSRLFQRVAAREMPPSKELPLTDEQIATIGRWIDAGSPAQPIDSSTDAATGAGPSDSDRAYWAFRQLGSIDMPRVRTTNRVRDPVDAFVLEQLESRRLTLSPEAEPTTLLRRAYFDLIGLPPSPQELDDFLADTAPDAYERVLDRLLASPHFGERWGRHWLDAAGYVDVLGGDNDAGTIKLSSTKWLYRDYVVRSLNADKSFDQFLVEQLAGDELVDWRSAEHFTPQIKELLVATGFMRTAADDTDENELNTADIRHGVLQRTAEVIASNLLALTVNCAKCHDHKYDPISQRDYYVFQAAFAPALNPQHWLQPKQRTLADISSADRTRLEQQNAALDSQIAEANRQIAELRKPYRDRLIDQKLAQVPEAIREDTGAALKTPAANRTEVQRYLAAKFESSLTVGDAEVATQFSEPDRATEAELIARIAQCNRQRAAWGEIQAIYDVGPPLPSYILRRGNHETPGPEVQAGFFGVLRNPAASNHTAECSLGATPFDDDQRAIPTGTSGRRLELARTLTDWSTAAGALVARVQVNRIWQHLFGRGIVETSDNFGRSGTTPTHPVLLEWLATDYVANGRHLKPSIKSIMMSSAYRQASEVRERTTSPIVESDDPRGAVIDPENSFLWRQRMRRLESEIIRDTILAVSGQLDRTFGGPPIPIEARPDGMVVIKGQATAGAENRRTIYLLARRNYHPTLLAVFDQPALPTNCTARTSSAVVLQSLAMLNDEFVRAQADRFAERVESLANSGNRIACAFRIGLGRDPTGPELAWAAEFVVTQSRQQEQLGIDAERSSFYGLAKLCHVLLNTSEFLYVE